MYCNTIIKHFRHPLNLDINPQSEVFRTEDAPHHLKATNSSAIYYVITKSIIMVKTFLLKKMFLYFLVSVVLCCSWIHKVCDCISLMSDQLTEKTEHKYSLHLRYRYCCSIRNIFTPAS